jgi:hypothetical protein
MEAVRHLKAQRTVGCPFVFATRTGKYLIYRNPMYSQRVHVEPKQAGDIHLGNDGG